MILLNDQFLRWLRCALLLLKAIDKFDQLLAIGDRGTFLLTFKRSGVAFGANAAFAAINLFLVFLAKTMALLRQQIVDAKICLATGSILLRILIQVIGLQAKVDQGVIETYMLWHLIIAVFDHDFDTMVLVVLVSLRLQLLQFLKLRLECAQSLLLLLLFLIAPLL